MNKKDDIKYMIDAVEKIEHERMAENTSIDPTKNKKPVIDNILKALDQIQFDESEFKNENK